jgi:hypothetical protein
MMMFTDDDDCDAPAPFDEPPNVLAAPEPGPAAVIVSEVPIAVIYPSRSGGLPHIVTRQPTEPPIISCTCMATLSLDRRPRGCHAMVAARVVMGLPPV